MVKNLSTYLAETGTRASELILGLASVTVPSALAPRS
jgi:hypothetical protein